MGIALASWFALGVALLNVELIASGTTVSTFTDDNLKKAYGGKFAVLAGQGD
jgi:hypothetical protein